MLIISTVRSLIEISQPVSLVGIIIKSSVKKFGIFLVIFLRWRFFCCNEATDARSCYVWPVVWTWKLVVVKGRTLVAPCVLAEPAASVIRELNVTTKEPNWFETTDNKQKFYTRFWRETIRLCLNLSDWLNMSRN